MNGGKKETEVERILETDSGRVGEKGGTASLNEKTP